MQAAIDAWAAAWSARDMDGYLAAYTPQYAGRLGSRRAWEEQRRSRILSKKKISVDLDPPQLVARGDTVVATFQQRYRGDEVVERSRKRLVLVKADNRWLIQDETELP
ncbi:nuclear transport factor 2 family protein [Piscinibacter sakaiensis]|uniref:L,D-transpeptidase Cds6 family protein n=1 Tax=Piscinibacter sakaiensis TaxID=1547922 RepID=UPI003729AB8E